MKFEKDDICDKMRQAALFAIHLEAVVENRLAGRTGQQRESPPHEMIRDKRDARGANKLSFDHRWTSTS